MDPLPVTFFDRPAPLVARALLGMRLARRLPDGTELCGRIVETEAYSGIEDAASHGFRRMTPRARPMWGPPGRSYVYFTYGMHWLLNVSCEAEGTPAAVLLRGLEPLSGIPAGIATDGPAKLARALYVDGGLNGTGLTERHGALRLERGAPVPDAEVRSGPRIGITRTPEPWLSIPWRWWVAGSAGVSRRDGLR